MLHRFRFERQRAAGNDRPLHYTAWRTPEEANGPIAYYKGAAVLNLLRYQLGDPAFWEGIRRYTTQGVGRSVTSNDLKAAMESAGGEDLTPFFQHWVFEARTPELSGAFVQSEGGVTVTITQRQKDSAWTFPVQVAVQTAAGRESRRVLLHGPSTEVVFRASAPLLSVRIDDGGHLPIRVAYDRPLAMLQWQAKNEPDVAGRVEALQLLARSAQERKGLTEESRVDDLLDASAATDPSRLVRQVASGLLEQLKSGPEK
jgi:aminopeptidase N